MMTPKENFPCVPPEPPPSGPDGGKRRVIAFLPLALLATAMAQTVAADDVATGMRRVVVFCGHPGDAAHREQFVDSIDRMTAALVENWNVPEDALHVLFGSRQMQEDGGPFPVAAEGPCTVETMRAALARLQAELKPDDALWVIVMGHGYFDGRLTWFNVPGPDPNVNEFAEMFAKIDCRECVFWMTTSVSGFFLKPLSVAGRGAFETSAPRTPGAPARESSVSNNSSGTRRVVITATEADREINATLFPHALADVITDPPPAEEFDADRDGRLSLLDLYVAVCRNVARRYANDQLIMTEHAQLDDNGDGRGSEVQIGYLAEELGGRLKEGERPGGLSGNRDGARAAAIPLSVRELRSTGRQPTGDVDE